MNTAAFNIPRNSLSLGLFCLISAILLATAYAGTRDRIFQQQLEAERQALAQVLPAAFHDNDLLQHKLLFSSDSTLWNQTELLALTSDRPAYLAYRDAAFAGIILPVEAHDGYSGDIRLLVGILADGDISGVRVLEHRETPGLGDKIDIDQSDWILTFNGKSLSQPLPARWRVLKDGGEFDQLVGATITPRAIVNAVQRALSFFEANQARLKEL